MAPGVVEVDRLAVGGVQERCPQPAEVERAVGKPLGVPPSLDEYPLRAKRQPFGLNDPQHPTSDGERVIGRAVRRWILGKGDLAGR
jgi:hypothetical protein